jgi:hypothetical protein
VPANVDGRCVEQRILEQSVRLPPGGALTAWAALRWQGAHYFDGLERSTRRELPVPLVLGGWLDIGRDQRVAVSRERFWWHEITLVAGVPCAIPERALFDEMRRSTSLRSAVVTVDMTVAAGLTSLQAMSEYVAGRNGWTGVPGARKALLLATADCRSPQESRMRLIWMLDAALPEPRCNRPVFDLQGHLLGYPDLFDPVAGVVGEYDGADHTERDRRRSDAAREEVFRDHDLEYFELVRGDLASTATVVKRMLGARRRAKFLPSGRRQWTLDPPPWWRNVRAAG